MGGGWLLVGKTTMLWIHEESVMNSKQNDLTDYKFMCFSGKPQMVFTCTGRAEGDLRVDFFNLSWGHLPFVRHYPNADVLPKAPEKLDTMINLAGVLSQGLPFVRVDFYESRNQIFFGEMTFYPGSGLEEFEPEEWDYKLGSLIDLNDIKRRY